MGTPNIHTRRFTFMSRLSDYEFAGLNGIELKKIKELETEINRKMRVNSGREIFLMAMTTKDKMPNEAGEMNDEPEPTWSL